VAQAESLRFGLLGPLEIRRGPDPIAVTASKQRALLAILLLHANRLVPADRLIEELWGGEPPGTAAAALQVYVAKLRRALDPGAAPDTHPVIVTRAPGYLLRIAPEQLDVLRFEELFGEAVRLLEQGEPSGAAATCREALALWRGEPLADLVYEPFAQTPIARLEELRLAALETRIDADLALGRHGELIAELRELTDANPARERLCAALMLALYRSGRQAEALDAYQRTRRRLVDDLGIEPGGSLQRLERAILQQDPELDLAERGQPGSRGLPGPAAQRRSILVASDSEDDLAQLLPIAACLAASRQSHDLILLRLVLPDAPDAPAALVAATRELSAARVRLGEQEIGARVAAFTSGQPARDTLRLVSEQDVYLVLATCPAAVVDGAALPDELAAVLADSLADVALLVARASPPELAGGGPVVAPFVGADHDWASLELAAWLASAAGATLRLLGSAGDDGTGLRDASRLLAVASLAAQELAGIVAEPAVVAPAPEALVAAAEGAALVVLPFPSDWHQRGLGQSRLTVCRNAEAPVLLVRAGVRPGGLTPPEGLTRYTWTLPAASA
jgi:DNA-binding SARP family transcriptional activator